MRRHELKIVVNGLLNELPVGVINWARFETDELRVKDHLEIVR